MRSPSSQFEADMRTVEFRVPMSPTRSFYYQARLFDFALRRLRGRYAEAKVSMVVGDKERVEKIKADNAWSAGRNVEWMAVPESIFDRYGIHGTADFRYLLPSKADFIVLSDADTALVGNIDPLIDSIDPNEAVVAGHMAHWPPATPESCKIDALGEDDLWPKLLEAFDLEMPERLYRYSMDPDGRFAPIPAYFNLGFILMTRPALEIFSREIFATQDKLLNVYPTNMRCQIAVSLMALAGGVRLHPVSAEYNLANDMGHLEASDITVGDARVIHYLRGDELKRETMALPEGIQQALSTPTSNSINRRLQALLSLYAVEELARDATNA